MIKHDEMTPTNINAPSPPAESTAAPIVVPNAQQSISAVSVVEPAKTPTIAKAIQETAAPKAAGGNLIMQQAVGQAAVAVPMQQTQNAPQVITPISTLKTS